MDDFVFPLLLALDVQSLTMSLVNLASPRGGEGALADSVEVALRSLSHLDVERNGDTIVASANAGHGGRVVVAARLDVASTDEDPLAYVEMGKLFGPGACDAKGALAMTLKAAALGGFNRDITFVFCAGSSGLSDLGDVLSGAEFVLLAEPTGCAVFGGALDHPRARRLIELTEVDPGVLPDFIRPEPFGVPTVAFGPGDPSLAGAPGEFVPTAELGQCEYVLRTWLTA